MNASATVDARLFYGCRAPDELAPRLRRRRKIGVFRSLFTPVKRFIRRRRNFFRRLKFWASAKHGLANSRKFFQRKGLSAGASTVMLGSHRKGTSPQVQSSGDLTVFFGERLTAQLKSVNSGSCPKYCGPEDRCYNIWWHGEDFSLSREAVLLFPMSLFS